MREMLNMLIKGLIFFRFVFAIFVTLSVIMVGSELYITRNQIEGRELIESTPKELIFLLTALVALITTLLFDIRTLKLKEELVYKEWLKLLFLTILTIIVAIIFKIQWLGISLMMFISIYAIFLLYKYSIPEK